MMTNDVLIARSPVLSRDLFAHLFPIFLYPRKETEFNSSLSVRPAFPAFMGQNYHVSYLYLALSLSRVPTDPLLASFLGEIPRDINFPPGSDPPYRRALRTLRRDSDVFPQQSKHHSSIFIQQGPQY